MRRVRLLIVVGLLLTLPSLSCRRRAAGTCADHVDCDPGFDCVDHRCTRRAAVGAGAAAAASDAGAAIAAPDPVFPASGDDETPTPAPPPRPVVRPTTPRRPAPAVAPAADSPPVPAAGDRLPAWQQRRKTF
ncbi:MAG TPA: hypothetical protein VGL59_25435 [Polyangia bacterium]